jgi:biopolymer transport protein ExbD
VTRRIAWLILLLLVVAGAGCSKRERKRTEKPANQKPPILITLYDDGTLYIEGKRFGHAPPLQYEQLAAVIAPLRDAGADEVTFEFDTKLDPMAVMIVHENIELTGIKRIHGVPVNDLKAPATP